MTSVGLFTCLNSHICLSNFLDQGLCEKPLFTSPTKHQRCQINTHSIFKTTMIKNFLLRLLIFSQFYIDVYTYPTPIKIKIKNVLHCLLTNNSRLISGLNKQVVMMLIILISKSFWNVRMLLTKRKAGLWLVTWEIEPKSQFP